MSIETVLVTGAAGFIGPQVVRLLLSETEYRVIVIDKLTYAARVENGKPFSLEMILGTLPTDVIHRYAFVQQDVGDPRIKDLIEAAKVDYIIHMAAESHVDRSTEGKPDFIQTEIFGTYNLLEAIRAQNSSGRHKVKRAVFVSTDEVYGSIDRISGYEAHQWYSLSDTNVSDLIKKYQFTEQTSIAGGSPYAACKGGADLLVGAYFNTFKWDKNTGKIDSSNIPLIITRGVNNFGLFQHPEKLIPMAICTLLMPDVPDPENRNKTERRCIPIYDKGLAVREWLTTEDYASAICHVLKNGEFGEVYNVGSGNRCRNRDLLIAIFRACKPYLPRNADLAKVCFDATTTGGVARPGHDLCYSVNCNKLRKLGWQPKHAGCFEEKIKEVVDWYYRNPDWWKPLWTGKDFTEFWDKKYRKIMGLPDCSFEFYTQNEKNRSLNDSLL